MDDSDFISSAKLAPVIINSGELKCQACIDAANTFRLNSARIHELISLPGFAVMLAQKWIASCTRANNEITGQAELTEEMMKIHGKAVVERANVYMAEKMQTPPAEQRPELYFSTGVFTQFANRSEYVSNALQDLLVSMLVLAWTSFEVLVKQLLEFSIRLHSECFPHLSGNEDFKFQKTELFRFSYKVAFNNSGRIQTKLHDQSVDALCIIRNLLVHNGGIVDEKFLARCRETHSTAWASLPLNQPFKCTGKAVQSLIDANTKCGYSLIKAVDRWLSEKRTAK